MTSQMTESAGRQRRRSEDRPVREPREPREPRAPREERPTRVLRDADGGESHAPAFLQAPPQTAARPEGEEAVEAPARRPRRRRAPRSFEGGDDGSPTSSETEGA